MRHKATTTDMREMILKERMGGRFAVVIGCMLAFKEAYNDRVDEDPKAKAAVAGIIFRERDGRIQQATRTDSLPKFTHSGVCGMTL